MRSLLLAGTALAATLVVSSGPALADTVCSVSGGTVTCSGSQSGGIDVPSSFTTLNINGVSGNITPASGVDGISFLSNGDVNIVGDAGSRKILVSGEGANGIEARSFLGGDVSVAYRGEVRSLDGYGLFATTMGDIDVVTVGPVRGALGAIYLQSYDDGTITIDHDGSLSSTAGHGVYATTQGNVDYTGSGGITSALDGIHLQSFMFGTIDIDHSGKIDAQGGYGVYATTQGDISAIIRDAVRAEDDAIYLHTYNVGTVELQALGDIASRSGSGIVLEGQGPISLIAEGSISAAIDGISVHHTADAATYIEHSDGSIVASTGSGIKAVSASGEIGITNVGDITASEYGIYASATSNRNVTIDQSGGTIVSGDVGIYAISSSGEVFVTGTGDVFSDKTSVFARSSGAQVAVTQTGNIVAGIADINAFGIHAESTGGPVTITGNGTIVSTGKAIYATSGGAGGVEINRTGDVTSINSIAIDATSSSGHVAVTNVGTVAGATGGISASATSVGAKAEVWQVGDVDGGTGRGIVATSASGRSYVNLLGNVVSDGDAVTATNTSGESVIVDVFANGGNAKVTSTTGRGIVASSTTGPVTVNTDAEILSYLTAITATNTASGIVDVSHSGGTLRSITGDGIFVSTTSGDITIENDSDIFARDGIHAVSTAGGEGIVDITQSGGTIIAERHGIYAGAGDARVSVYVGGDIDSGDDGIYLTGYGDLNVTVNEGVTVTGGAGASAVYFDHGLSNKLTNYGTLTTEDGILGDTIVATLSENRIENYGTIVGNVELTNYTNEFHNFYGALFDMGETVSIGNWQRFINEGTLSPGGVNNIATTNVTASLINNAGSTLLVDVDLQGATTDQFVIANDAELHGGGVRPNFVSFDWNERDPLTFLTTGNYVSIKELAVWNQILFTADIVYPDGDQSAAIQFTDFDFNPEGLTGNASEIGAYLNKSLPLSNGLSPIAAGLLNLDTFEQIDQALNTVAPDLYLSNQIAAVYNAADFNDQLFSCKVQKGANFFSAEGDCVWTRADIASISHSSEAEYTGFKGDSWGISGGAQYTIAPDWHLGFALDSHSRSLSAQNGGLSESHDISGGVVAKYAKDGLLLAGSLAGSYGWYDVTRPMDFGGFSDAPTATTEIGTVTARARAAYTAQVGQAYARPQLDVEATWLQQGAITETGGAAAVSALASDDVALSISPSLEVGGQVKLHYGVYLRPFFKGGATIYSEPGASLQGSFNADDVDTDPYTITSASDKVLWKFSAGVDLMGDELATFRLFYASAYGETTTVQSGGLKASMKF